MMFRGHFESITPGITYAQRLTFEPDSSLIVDPSLAGAVIEGEWLQVAGGKAILADPTATDPVLQYPLITGKGRTDLQSGNRLTVFTHKGNICRTNVFATNGGTADGVGNQALDYGTDPIDLVLCEFVDKVDFNVTRIGLCPAVNGAGVGQSFEAAIVSSAADLGAIVTKGTRVVAQLIQAPYAFDALSVVDIVVA